MESGPGEQFVQQLIGVQDRLYAYVYSLLGDANSADDVVQQSNVVLWRKADDFTPGSDFGAWACSVAYFEVLAWRQKLGRDRLRFNDQLIQRMAAQSQQVCSAADDTRRALRECLAGLTDPQRKLMELRYEPGMTVKEIAQQLNRPAGSIAQTLYRIRTALAECVKQKLAAEEQE